MATKKSATDYTRVSIYFNLDEPDQQKIYNLLQAVGRKKTAFLMLMATSFATEYANTSVLEPENLKVYLKHPSLLKDVAKNKKQMALAEAPHDPVMPVVEHEVSAPAPQPEAVSVPREFAKTEDAPVDASDFDDERASKITKALSAFAV